MQWFSPLHSPRRSKEAVEPPEDRRCQNSLVKAVLESFRRWCRFCLAERCQLAPAAAERDLGVVLGGYFAAGVLPRGCAGRIRPIVECSGCTHSSPA